MGGRGAKLNFPNVSSAMGGWFPGIETVCPVCGTKNFRARIEDMSRLLWSLSVILAMCGGSAKATVDTSQAQAMVRLLERCHSGEVSQANIDEVMEEPGTLLIIAQQNISRRITPAQYRAVLESACRGEIANVQPSEPGARAEKGVQGLTRDVAPSLLWGRDHVDYLRKRLAVASEDKDFKGVVPLAQQNLPEKVHLSAKLYLVMGGRAGAAALADGIYIDLLSDAWRSRENGAPMSPQEMVEFFAHEMHHVGYDEILQRRRQHMHLAGGEEQAWSFLTAIAMEGSATLLINAHGSWAELKKQDHIRADLPRLPQLLPEMQSLLQRTLEGKISDMDYQAAESDFFGEGYHVTGARVLYVIEQVQGKAGVMKVMDDPRTLLSVYNACAAKSDESFRFDSPLAGKLETLGTGRNQGR